MYSKKQLKAIGMIDKLEKKFGIERWFTQAELPGITLHTLKALVDKGYLRWMGRPMDAEPMGTIYYQIIPPQERRI